MKQVILRMIIHLYNEIMATDFINKNGRIRKRLRLALMHNLCFEFKGKLGKLNPNRKFMIIRCPQDTMGFFGVYNYVVDYIRIADENGYEPVVDWQYFPNGGTTVDKFIGKENSWNWFFEPLVDVPLEAVYHSQDVWLTGGENYASLGESYERDKLFKSNYIINKYIHLSDKMQNKLKDAYECLKMEDKRVLGVLARGTYFVTNKPKDHATIPSNSLLVDAINGIEEENGKYDLIFLATEDITIRNCLKDTYGERLIYSQKKVIERVDGRWVNELFDDSRYQDTKIQIAEEYLISIMLLAKSNDILASMVGGTLGALRISKGYDNVYIINEKGYKKVIYDK